MTDFASASKNELGSADFIRRLQNSDLVPLNDVTKTDFIVSGGITLALRKANRGVVLKIEKHPLQLSIAVPHANQRLRNQNGEATIREILAAILTSYRSRRVRLVVDQTPPEGLIDTIFNCLYLAARHDNPQRPWRTVIYAPSALQDADFSTALTDQSSSRAADVRAALRPLLALIPQGEIRFEEVGGMAAHDWARGHDCALIPDQFEYRISTEESLGVVDRMKMMSKILAEIPKFGVEPLPVVNILNV